MDFSSIEKYRGLNFSNQRGLRINFEWLTIKDIVLISLKKILPKYQYSYVVDILRRIITKEFR